jgi:hypothetical protein
MYVGIVPGCQDSTYPLAIQLMMIKEELQGVFSHNTTSLVEAIASCRRDHLANR